jgi:TetR/AcrR family transcriptional regulator
MSKRTLDPESTRASILEAAEELFAAKGYDAVSMSDIGRAAGVTKSLIHHHFGAKEELWHAVKERCMSEYFTMQRHLLEQPQAAAGDLLRLSIETYFRFLQKNPRVVRMQAWLDILQDPVMVAAAGSVTELGQHRLRVGQQHGEIRLALEPLHIIGCFLGMTEHWFRSRAVVCAKSGLSPDMPAEEFAALDESFLQTMCGIFFDGVLTDAGRKAVTAPPSRP